MNNIEKIKDKIKKLLALSKSPNPNEAATALKMAQELMEEYKIDTSAVNSLDMVEDTVKTVERKKPPLYEALIIRKIAAAFGCEHFYDRRGYKYNWVFIGLEHRVKIATYIAVVLLRKIKNVRKEHLKTLKRVRPVSKKTKRADEFCFYWAYAVTEKLPEFANISREEQNELELYTQKKHPNLTEFTPRYRKGHAADRAKGYNEGKNVQLQHGVGGEFQSPLYLEA